MARQSRYERKVMGRERWGRAGQLGPHAYGSALHGAPLHPPLKLSNVMFQAWYWLGRYNQEFCFCVVFQKLFVKNASNMINGIKWNLGVHSNAVIDHSRTLTALSSAQTEGGGQCRWNETQEDNVMHFKMCNFEWRSHRRRRGGWGGKGRKDAQQTLGNNKSCPARTVPQRQLASGTHGWMDGFGWRKREKRRERQTDRVREESREGDNS